MITRSLRWVRQTHAGKNQVQLILIDKYGHTMTFSCMVIHYVHGEVGRRLWRLDVLAEIDDWMR